MPLRIIYSILASSVDEAESKELMRSCESGALWRLRARNLEPDVAEPAGDQEGAAGRGDPIRGCFVPEPERARVTRDGDSTLLAGHHLVGDGVAH